MKVLLSWLNEFADFGDDYQQIADDLTALGLAVESVENVGGRVDGVVVASVLRVETHPDAAKVRRVWVDAGDGVERHVWCGASNMAAGDLVPLAQLDTSMPDGRTITRRGILGIDSEGMLCSATELNLGGDASGILILPQGLSLGQNVFDALGVRADVVLDLDVTRNRPDCNGYLGVARDLAAKRQLAMRMPTLAGEAEGKAVSVPVRVEAPERCPRFSVTIMSGIVVGPSPDWIVRRLAGAGMRTINNVVDVSNLVNLELNQPNHAYDAETVRTGFVVRTAKNGETIVTLDGLQRTLTEEDLLICDGDERPVGIAGIMGGLNSEVSDATTSIALEIAYFEPHGVAQSVTRLGLRTEASMRFERGVDPHNVDVVVRRFAALLRQTSPNLLVHEAGADVISGSLPVRERMVELRLSQLTRVLGVELTVDDVAKLIGPLGFAITGGRGNGVAVGIPSWRPDCTEEIDVVEEVARQYGYDALGKVLPMSPVHGELTLAQQRRRKLREVVLSLGASEAMPNPFFAPGEQSRCGLDEATALTLANPLVAEESVLRVSLRPGLLKAVAYNQSHRVPNVVLFELGHVYPQGKELLPDEYESLCVMFAGEDASWAVDVWSQLSDAMEVGAQIDSATIPSGFHPTRSATLRRGKTLVGAMGEIHPDVLRAMGVEGRVACLELHAGMICEEIPRITTAKNVSRYPSTDFDLAFIVPDDVPAANVSRALRQAGGSIVVSIDLFDVYRGTGVSEGMRSLAYRVRAQAEDRTLNDAEVSTLRASCIAAAEKLGATLR